MSKARRDCTCVVAIVGLCIRGAIPVETPTLVQMSNTDVRTLQLDNQPHDGRRELLSSCYYTTYFTGYTAEYSSVYYQSSYQYTGQTYYSYSCGKGETCYTYYTYYATGYETLSYQAIRPSPATQTRTHASESPAREHAHARTR